MISVDRSHVSNPFAQEYGTTRTLTIDKNEPLSLQIFVDHSVCEIFVNGGQAVLTARVFPNHEEKNVYLEGISGDFSADFWCLRNMKTTKEYNERMAIKLTDVAKKQVSLPRRSHV